MKRIVLCSRHPLMIAGFQTVIQASDEFTMSVCPDIALLHSAILAEGADLIVADVDCGVTLDALTGLHMADPTAAVVLWVDTVSPEFISQAIGQGVLGVLRKDATAEMCLKCLRQALAGELWMENELSQKLVRMRSVRLTPRERQLTALLAQGLRNKELAYRLGISEGTVKVYLSRLYSKLRVSDRLELALLALKNMATDQTRASEDLTALSAAAGGRCFMPAMMSMGQVPARSH